METRSKSSLKAGMEERPRRMLKVTEKVKETNMVKPRTTTKPKATGVARKTYKRKTDEEASRNKANGKKISSLTGDDEPFNHPQYVPFSSNKKKSRAVNVTTGMKRKLPKVAEATGMKRKLAKVAEEPKKTKNREPVEEASSGNEANGAYDSQSAPFSSNKTKTRAINALGRRSGRIKNLKLSENIQENKDAPHDEINLTDSDGEVELHVEPIVSTPTRVVAIPELKTGKKPFASEPTQMVDYRTLYIDSQKKMEASTEENYKRAIELSYLRGKVDAYEYIIGNMKNIDAFSNMKRVIDAETNLSDGTAPALNPENEPDPSLNENHVRRLKKNSL